MEVYVKRRDYVKGEICDCDPNWKFFFVINDAATTPVVTTPVVPTSPHLASSASSAPLGFLLVLA